MWGTNTSFFLDFIPFLSLKQYRFQLANVAHYFQLRGSKFIFLKYPCGWAMWKLKNIVKRNIKTIKALYRQRSRRLFFWCGFRLRKNTAPVLTTVCQYFRNIYPRITCQCLLVQRYRKAGGNLTSRSTNKFIFSCICWHHEKIYPSLHGMCVCVCVRERINLLVSPIVKMALFVCLE